MDAVREAKAAALAQEELQNAIREIKSQLAIERQNLELIKSTNNCNATIVDDLNKIKAELKSRAESLEATREAINDAIISKTYLRKYIATSEPSEHNEWIRQQEMAKKLEESYQQNSEYRRVVEAQSKTQELEELISEKRNEYMRLEAAEKGLDHQI